MLADDGAGKIEGGSGDAYKVEDESDAVGNECRGENERSDESGRGYEGERGDVAGERENGDTAEESRVNWLDLLLPVGIGALAAALALVAPHIGTNGDDSATVERIAVALGVPLFLLNHFFAPRPLRFALGL